MCVLLRCGAGKVYSAVNPDSTAKREMQMMLSVPFEM
jgi:hypothetical protein